jgi:ABC-2 type transport system permease protein
VALIVRHTGAALTAVLSLLYTFPIIAALVTDPDWRKWLMRLAPMTAGLAIQATRNLDAQPIAPWAGLGVLAGYAAAAAALGAVLFQRRDA